MVFIVANKRDEGAVLVRANDFIDQNALSRLRNAVGEEISLVPTNTRGVGVIYNNGSKPLTGKLVSVEDGYLSMKINVGQIPKLKGLIDEHAVVSASFSLLGSDNAVKSVFLGREEIYNRERHLRSVAEQMPGKTGVSDRINVLSPLERAA